MVEYLASVNQLYQDNLVQFGTDSKAVGWKDRKSQQLRFAKLNQIILDKDKPITVNDYGCGYGAHLSNLIESNFTIAQYNGYDINIEMLNSLQKIHNQNHDMEIRCINSSKISTIADYSLVSGTFNVPPDSDMVRWEKFVAEKISEIAMNSRQGFSFNLLSSYVDWKKEGLYYADPGYWFDFCKKNLSTKVTLLHDYPLYEWTILVDTRKGM